jgi:hypothetical protein
LEKPIWTGLAKHLDSAGWNFSLKNVLKREYNGFFAIFISFALVDAMKNYVHFGFSTWKDLISPFWLYALAISFVIFITLRTLKKHTKMLDASGREFTK